MLRKHGVNQVFKQRLTCVNRLQLETYKSIYRIGANNIENNLIFVLTKPPPDCMV